MEGVLFPVQKGLLCVQKKGRNYRDSSSRGTILCVTNGCQLRSRGPKVRCLSGLGVYTNLDWARRVCVYFGVGITIAVHNRRFMDSRQADQVSSEPRGTRTRGSMSVGGASAGGTAHPYVRASHTCLSTPLNYRSGQRVSSSRDVRVRSVGKMVRSHFWSSASYLCVVLTGLGHPWYSAVDNATGGRLSSGRHGVGAGGT